MKKLLFFFIFFTLSMTTFGQDVNYFDYHRAINQTEDFLINEKFLKAAASYDSIFLKYPKPFVKDVIIAAQVAILFKLIRIEKKWVFVQ